MAETSSNEKRGRNLPIEVAHQYASILQFPQAGSLARSRLQGRRSHRGDPVGDHLKRRVEFERVEENCLRGFEPLIIGFKLWRRQRLFPCAGEENGEREGPAYAVDRWHEHANRRFAAEIRAQPEAPDRRAVIGFAPSRAQHLLR